MQTETQSNIIEQKVDFNDYDIFIYEAILRIILPDSIKGNYTSIETIMNSGGIANMKIRKERVLELLYPPLKDDGTYDMANPNSMDGLFYKSYDNKGNLTRIKLSGIN